MHTVKISKYDDRAVMPNKTHVTDSGYDVTIIGVYKELSPLIKLYDTGIKMAPSPGIYMDLVARSSLMKMGYMLANGVGIIDNTYRGPLLVALYKFDPNSPDISFPCKVAQLIPRQVISADFFEVETLDETVRGDGGFGSTGIV